MLPPDAIAGLSAAAKNQDGPVSPLVSKLVTNQPTTEPAPPPVPEKPQQPLAEKPPEEAAWSIEESKSPIDDSPQVTGILFVEGSGPPAMTGLTLRCKEKKTEVIFAKQFAFFGTTAPLKVLMRINDGKPIESQWQPSSNGQGAFAPAAVQFIRALPDDGRLFIRATGSGGTTVDGAFTLGKVSELRNKIATACRWPEAVTPASATHVVSPTGQRPK